MDRKSLLAGLALGIGAGVAARALYPAFAPALRPLAKSGMRAAVLGYERAREVLGEVAENLEDAFAEVRADMEGLRTSEAIGADGHAPQTAEPG